MKKILLLVISSLLLLISCNHEDDFTFDKNEVEFAFPIIINLWFLGIRQIKAKSKLIYLNWKILVLEGKADSQRVVDFFIKWYRVIYGQTISDHKTTLVLYYMITNWMPAHEIRWKLWNYY